MSKNKIILIALIVSLVILIVFNIIYNKHIKEEVIQAYILTEDVIKGEIISSEKIEKVEISSNLKGIEYITEITEPLYAASLLKEGQVLTSKNLITKQENDKGYEYISIPITTSDDAIAYKIKKGSVINIYFTGKVKQVENVLQIKNNTIYSSNENEAIISTMLFERISVAGVYDSLGSNDTLFTQIVIMVSKEDAVRIINLKQLGIFTLTLVE